MGSKSAPPHQPAEHAAEQTVEQQGLAAQGNALSQSHRESEDSPCQGATDDEDQHRHAPQGVAGPHPLGELLDQGHGEGKDEAARNQEDEAAGRGEADAAHPGEQPAAAVAGNETVCGRNQTGDAGADESEAEHTRHGRQAGHSAQVRGRLAAARLGNIAYHHPGGEEGLGAGIDDHRLDTDRLSLLEILGAADSLEGPLADNPGALLVHQDAQLLELDLYACHVHVGG